MWPLYYSMPVVSSCCIQPIMFFELSVKVLGELCVSLELNNPENHPIGANFAILICAC